MCKMPEKRVLNWKDTDTWDKKLLYERGVGFNEAWDAWVDPDNTPARACVEAKMATPAILVEIMVTASR